MSGVIPKIIRNLKKIIVVILDNRGYGCIERLQVNSGGASFNNMLDDCIPEGGQPSSIDFAMHGRSMGAEAVHVQDVAELRRELVRARDVVGHVNDDRGIKDGHWRNHSGSAYLILYFFYSGLLAHGRKLPGHHASRSFGGEAHVPLHLKIIYLEDNSVNVPGKPFSLGEHDIVKPLA